MPYERQKYCNIIGCKHKDGTPQRNESVTMFRIPNEAKKREQWIEQIHNHQKFTMNDQRTSRFSVCNLHFEPNKIKRLKGRVGVEGPPTIFPKITKATSPPQQVAAPIAPPALQQETTEKVPMIDPQSCVDQYRKRFAPPTVLIEKIAKGHSSAPMAKLLSKMTAQETAYKKEIARLRMELEQSQKKCMELQQQLDVYQNTENDQRPNEW